MNFQYWRQFVSNVIIKPKLLEILIMKKLLFLANLVLTGTLWAESLYFDGKTEKNPVLYKAGEPMTFLVVLRDKDAGGAIVKGRKLVWNRTGDDGKKECGEALSDEPLKITTRIDKPGFVRIIVNVLDHDGNPKMGLRERFESGAGADVNQLPADPLPADFHAFWNAEVARLHCTPFDTKVVELPHRDDVKVLKFSIGTFPGERPATGYILYPRDAAPNSLPMTVKFSGYGFNATRIPFEVAKQGRLVVEVTRHGEEPDRESEYYKELQEHAMKNYCFRNNNDKYKNDFYGMYMRGQRAMQYAETLLVWNRQDIRVEGGSMGAAQAIAAAALNPHVTECVAHIPWMADLAGKAKFQRMGGWAPEYTETLRYFDTANLATRVKCPTTIYIGLGDYVCPPSGQMILFRNLAGEKTIKIHQNRAHGPCLQPDPYETVFTGKIH